MSAQYLEKRYHKTEVYTCVSHVWGDNHKLTTLSNVTSKNQQHEISLNSNEIKHWFVNKIAHVDAEVPTWFYTYSMPQISESEVSRNMAVRHQIYTNADIRYILIEDPKFHYHLSKYHDASIVRSDNDTKNAARSITSVLNGSTYKKRVWTLQELLPIDIVYVACCKGMHSLQTLGLGGIYEHEFKDSRFKNIVTTKIDEIFELIYDESWLKYIYEKCSLSDSFRLRTGSILDMKQKPDRVVKLDDSERSRIWRTAPSLEIMYLDLSLGIEYEGDSIEIMQAWVTALVKEGLIRWGLLNGLSESEFTDSIPRPNDDYLGKIWASRKYVWPEIPVNTEIEMTELASNSDYDQLLDEHLVLFIVGNDWTYSARINNENKTVDNLKKAIRAKKPNVLKGLDANQFTLVRIGKVDMGGLIIEELEPSPEALDLVTYGKHPETVTADTASAFQSALGSCLTSDYLFVKVFVVSVLYSQSR
ncbi:hypothetical protein HK100_007184 [Physocladia obscura]|uniref:Heterokaryon incompatibility domain-containing protein n=1 Tax=Physocladia obscura TaxID=109957 RepID=A0AAD5SPN3_9FUNG|nr:hypothetical protein HK100_007184 [Physocladia obscura]